MRFARASLKPETHFGIPAALTLLSRAFCAGLIEAFACLRYLRRLRRYPVRFARASLKHAGLPTGPNGIAVRYPVRFARASLKPSVSAGTAARICSYPVRFARASLKLGFRWNASSSNSCYPVRFARASLKLVSFVQQVQA